MNQTGRDLDADGFAAIARAFDPGAVGEVEAILDSLLLRPQRSAWFTATRDLSERSTGGAPRQPEICRPSLRARRLQRSGVFVRCGEIATALLGCRAHYLFDHAIYKMPRSGTPTPWHQDLAYLGPFAGEIRSLHFWIPLQDTSVEGGALGFVPGSHRWPLVRHVPAYERDAHVLTAAAHEPRAVRYVPLRLGDVSIHTSLTMHGAGANGTDGIRKAWIIHFGDRPAWHKHLAKLLHLLPFPERRQRRSAVETRPCKAG